MSFFMMVLPSCNQSHKTGSFQGVIDVDDYQIDFKDCAVDNLGNAYFTGIVEPDYFKEGITPPEWLEGCQGSSMVLLKLDADGEQRILERFADVSVGNAVLIAENSDVVIVGYFYGNESPFTEEGRFMDVTLTRFNNEGKKLWSEVVFQGYESEGIEVVEVENELYVLTAQPDQSNFNAIIIKVSAQGQIISQTKIQHEWDIYPYQMIEKAGEIYMTAHVGGHGVVIQVNPETGAIQKSFGWNDFMSFPALASHPAGIVTASRGNNYSPIILFDKDLNEIRRDSILLDRHDGGNLRIISDSKGATYLLTATKKNTMELIKFNDQLKQLWRKEIDGTPKFKIGGMSLTKDGNILTSGRVGDVYLNGDGYYATFTPDGILYQ
jgi:hypothetical protein